MDRQRTPCAALTFEERLQIEIQALVRVVHQVESIIKIGDANGIEPSRDLTIVRAQRTLEGLHLELLWLGSCRIPANAATSLFFLVGARRQPTC
jgi:hypothetical protein